jgi:hypothetical protein
MSSRRLSAVLFASIGLLAACGGSPSSTPSSVTATTGTTTSSGATTPATTGPTTSSSGTTSPTTAPPGEPFVSSHYGYTVASSDWTGTDAAKAWDGTGAPGDGDPFVDTLQGPEGVRAFAVAEPTDATLEEYVAASRKANSKGHPCPLEPEKTRSTTVGGEPATLDETHCPARVGPYAINVIVIHDGIAHSFFTYTTVAGGEAFTRNWFEDLIPLISFDA